MRYLFILITLLWLPPVFSAPVAKAVTEAVEFAARRSGKTLTPAAREAAETALRRTAAQYGDEVLQAVRLGGLEALEQGGTHGPEIWRLAKGYPAAARGLALHADEWLPLIRRTGPEFLAIEARAPGLGTRITAEFGDDAVRRLANAPADDLSRLLGYGGKADSPETRKLLLDSYTKSSKPSYFLEQLNWKQIMAAGLSTAAIVAAYKVSDGAAEGLVTVAKESPEVFMAPARWGAGGLLLILAAWMLWHILRRKRK